MCHLEVPLQPPLLEILWTQPAYHSGFLVGILVTDILMGLECPHPFEILPLAEVTSEHLSLSVDHRVIIQLTLGGELLGHIPHLNLGEASSCLASCLLRVVASEIPVAFATEVCSLVEVQSSDMVLQVGN